MSAGYGTNLYETCPCGAVFEVPAGLTNAGSWCREFREAHKLCRPPRLAQLVPLETFALEPERVLAFCTDPDAEPLHRWWSVGEAVTRCPDRTCDCTPELWMPLENEGRPGVAAPDAHDQEERTLDRDTD